MDDVARILEANQTQSEAELILSQAIDAIVQINEKNEITFYNPAAERLWGYAPEEVIGKNVKMLVPPVMRDRHDGFVEANRTTGVDRIVGTSREVEIHRKDGSMIWGSLSLSKVRGADGRISYTAFVKDVTQEKAARDLFVNTLEQAIDAVVAIDENNHVTFFNAAAERLWGYGRDEVIGQNVKMLVPGHMQHKHDDFVNANRETGVDKIVGTSREVEVHCKDGSLKFASLSLSRVTDANNRKVYTAFLRDVSEDVRLREEFRRLSLVANKTDNSVIITDPAGCIEFVNPGFTALTGYGLDEVKGKKPGSFLQGPKTDQETVRRIREALHAKQAFYEEILNYDKDGQPYWISLAINPVFDESGTLVNFISIQANITSTKVEAVEYERTLEAINKTNGIIQWTADYAMSSVNSYVEDRAIARQRPALDRILTQDQLTKLSAGQSVVTETEWVTAAGDTIYMNSTFGAIIDVDGQVVKYVMVGLDITSKRLALTKTQEAVAGAQQSGDEISKIARAIKDVASQTNLLALNATIESARAGDAGKGFAVVASEVKSLAGTTANEAENISSLVEKNAALMDRLVSAVREI